eukprot:gene6292-3838_t
MRGRGGATGATSDSKQLQCWFDRRGKCKNGENCSFRHSGTSETEKAGDSTQNVERMPQLDKTKKNGMRWMTETQFHEHHGPTEGRRQWKAATTALTEVGIVSDGKGRDNAALVQQKGVADKLKAELQKENVTTVEQNPDTGKEEASRAQYVTIQAKVETGDHNYIGRVRNKLRELAAQAGSVVCPEGWWRSGKGVFELAVTAHKKRLKETADLLAKGGDRVTEYTE